MKSATSVVVRAVGLFGIGSLLAVGPALAAPLGGGGNGSTAAVPTLGGVGLAALAGALAVGGAWLVSRRDKQK
jgi:Zn-dependent alcohol dehydrogenase